MLPVHTVKMKPKLQANQRAVSERDELSQGFSNCGAWGAPPGPPPPPGSRGARESINSETFP